MADTLHLPEEQVEQAYRTVKTEADRQAERFGSARTCNEIYDLFLARVGKTYANGTALRNGVDALFQEHPPDVLDENIDALLSLQSKAIRLSITSNTNFVSGHTINATVLETWGVSWDFQIFSDQVGMSKPHPKVWEMVIEKVRQRTILVNSIYHVGDHRVCDASCGMHGIRFLRVNSDIDLALVLENTFR